jgi:hypothetical protein
MHFSLVPGRAVANSRAIVASRPLAHFGTLAK